MKKSVERTKEAMETAKAEFESYEKKDVK